MSDTTIVPILSPDGRYHWDGKHWLLATDKITLKWLETADAPLRAKVAALVGRGYRIETETETSAQLVKPKTFSFASFVLLTLFTGVGLILYPAWYLAKHEPRFYLRENGQGRVTVTRA